MKKFLLIGAFLFSLISSISAQSLDEITDLRLAHEFIPVELSDELLEGVDDPADLIESMTESVYLSAHFTVNNLIGLRGITCQLFGEAGNSTETYFPIESYATEVGNESYREKNYFVTFLGEHAYSDWISVKVKLEYTDRYSDYYSASIVK